MHITDKGQVKLKHSKFINIFGLLVKEILTEKNIMYATRVSSNFNAKSAVIENI